jgi:hypothetical protein
VLTGFTLLGGLQALSTALLHATGPGMVHQILLIVAFAIVSGAARPALRRTTASSCWNSASASTR